MSRPDRAYAFVEFIVRNEAALDRLATVAEEFQRQKQGEAIAEQGNRFGLTDRGVGRVVM